MKYKVITAIFEKLYTCYEKIKKMKKIISRNLKSNYFCEKSGKLCCGFTKINFHEMWQGFSLISQIELLYFLYFLDRSEYCFIVVVDIFYEKRRPCQYT